MKKVVVITSTDGSVLSAVISNIKDSMFCVVSDRECVAIDIAKRHNIKTIVIPCNNGEEFSHELCNTFAKSDIDLFVSFYTRLFKKSFLEYAKDRLVNFHPSILPACPGMDGFGESVRHGCYFIGSTVHLVDESIDAGKPVMQAAIPYNPNLSLAQNRHKIFVQQCKQFIQLIEWLNDGRINGNLVTGASYELSEFSPNLDSSAAISFCAEEGVKS